jgi:hypothetical protein
MHIITSITYYINKIFNKILNAYLKNLVTKQLEKYLIDKNIFCKTKLEKKELKIKIYNLELMIPSLNNINFIRFDIYQIIIIINFDGKSNNKIIINGVKILYQILDDKSTSNLFDSFINSVKIIVNDIINIKNPKDKIIYNKGIEFIENILDKKLEELIICVYNIKLYDFSNKISFVIHKLSIQYFGQIKLAISNIELFNDKKQTIVLAKKLKIIYDGINKFRINIDRVKFYFSKNNRIENFINILNSFQSDNKSNINLNFICKVKKCSIKYFLNNIDHLYINIFSINHVQDLNIANIDMYYLKNKTTNSLYRLLNICEINLDSLKQFNILINNITFHIYPYIFSEWYNLLDDLEKTINNIKLLFKNNNQGNIINNSKSFEKKEEIVLDNYLENIEDIKFLENYSINMENSLSGSNSLDDYYIVNDYYIVDDKKLDIDINFKLSICNLNIIITDSIENNNSIDIKSENIILTNHNGLFENYYTFYIGNMIIIDNIKKSLWYKLFYKEENNLPFVKILIVDQFINESHQYSVVINLNTLIFNIDQDVLCFLEHIHKTNTILNQGDNKKPNPCLYFKNFYINELDINISYKPKNVDFSQLFTGKRSEFLNLNVIHDLKIKLKPISIVHVSGFQHLANYIIDKWIIDIQENNLLKCLLTIGPTKHVYNIGSDIVDLINNIRYKSGNDSFSFINSSKDMFCILSDHILEITTRMIVSTQTAIENINDKSNDKISKYKNAPENVQDGIKGSYLSIKKSYNKITDTNLDISERMIQPIVGIIEAASKSLMGIQNSINKDKAKKNRNRYN